MIEEPEIGVLQPIGVVRSSLREPADAPNQSFEGAPEAVLELRADLEAALHRIRVGEEVIVLTWLHQARRDVLQTHPMDDPAIPPTGVFATRSPDRPNPIGLHRVRVVALEAPTVLRVDALEVVDGTPILDIKCVLAGSRDD